MDNPEHTNRRVAAGVALRPVSQSKTQHIPVILLDTGKEIGYYAVQFSACNLLLLDFHDEGPFIAYRIVGDTVPHRTVSVFRSATWNGSLRELASFNISREVHEVLLDRRRLLPLWTVVLLGEDRAHESLVSSRSGAVYHHEFQPLERHMITRTRNCGS